MIQRCLSSCFQTAVLFCLVFGFFFLFLFCFVLFCLFLFFVWFFGFRFFFLIVFVLLCFVLFVCLFAFLKILVHSGLGINQKIFILIAIFRTITVTKCNFPKKQIVDGEALTLL